MRPITEGRYRINAELPPGTSPPPFFTPVIHIQDSATNQFLEMFGIAGSLQLYLGGGAFDRSQVFRRELERDCTVVLLQAVEFRGAGDRNDPRFLSQHP